MTAENTNFHQDGAPLKSGTILLMAIAAGITVANIYYNQPILKEMAISLHATDVEIGRVSMFSQLGYGLGMFFLIPMGDMLNRKKLILLLMAALAFVLILMVLSKGVFFVWILSLLIGICSAPAQIILPMAASLDKVNRGKTVGIVFSGILVGILGSRVISGFITDWFGWRAVYGISAVMVVSVTILLKLYLPDVKHKFTGNYLELLKSTLKLVGEHRILRESAILGAFTFGIFCSFWTTVTFYLSGPAFNYHADTIGLFGLVAIGGALVAPWFGKLADNGNTRSSLLMTVAMIICSLVLLKVFPLSVIAMVAAIFVLDIGVQATQITNFAKIYSLDENSHSRLNTIYMTTYFIGGGIGTFFGLLCWKHGGWELSTWQMLIWSFIALGIVFFSKK
ncbi:Predicted arabinose efflux permease, MFS family [Pedobacter westerhofensis]|uniref:Predicted arabinose efflux permease, MFS family n=1 Tax=Pedobacter westerhofensis TaxID=425512 RepID=A0A521FHJ4_9SPHI|nr:MFS transporter [Pedobacter westerhofensis]SMO95529.1 Predicted arabinose efflux permease, MFS family [Pedobacter westerhofensis]